MQAVGSRMAAVNLAEVAMANPTVEARTTAVAVVEPNPTAAAMITTKSGSS
jgi:hypothetical protein